MIFDDISNQVYIVAQNEAKIQKHEYFTPEHLLYAMLMFEEGKHLVKLANGDIDSINEEILLYFQNYMTIGNMFIASESLSLVQTLENAKIFAQKREKEIITLVDILLAILNLKESYAVYILEKCGFSKKQLINNIKNNKTDFKKEKEVKSLYSENLKKYVTNLTEFAKNGELDVFVGREKELNRTIQILSRRIKNNPLHIGEAGVGKTSIVEGLALLLCKENIIGFENSVVLQLNLNKVIASGKYRGELEHKLITLLDEVSTLNNPILYIDDIHTLADNNGGSFDVYNILKPYFYKSNIRFIGSTTFSGYKKYISKDNSFDRRFQKIYIEETTLEETKEILLGIKEVYEKHHNVTYSTDVINLICKLSKKYIKDKFLPDKAIDVLDEVGAHKKLEKNEHTNITTKDVEKVISNMAKIPEETLNKNEEKLLKNLESSIKKEIFGQDAAIKSLCYSIQSSRLGFGKENAPISSLLFLGTTGVGKTETAKSLSKHLNIPLIRFDMSEYQEKHSASGGSVIGAF